MGDVIQVIADKRVGNDALGPALIRRSACRLTAHHDPPNQL
jgi:hypothetical protein